MFRRGSWDIIRGTIFVALGGLLATHGWNVMSLGEQRNNLIRAVSQEWVFHRDRLQSRPLKGKVYDNRQATMLFPFLNTNALRAVLSSGLWNFDDANDKELLLAIATYERILNVANDIFRSYNEQLARIDDDHERIAQAEQYRTTVDEAK